MENFSDSGNQSANTSVLSNGSVTSYNGSTSGEYSAEYLAQLLKDKRQLAAFPNVFVHLERLVDDEIQRVRVSLFHLSSEKKPMILPDAIGAAVQRQEKVFVPVNEYPDYNFVGRILGPRGMTAKQLEQETGCKIMIRGKGSMRDKLKEEQNRGKPNWEHLNEPLHVLLSCEDTENRCKVKLACAAEEIRKLLVPAAEGEDELKRKQLMELAIINGTYRPAAPAAKLQLPTFHCMIPFAENQRLLPAGLQALTAAIGANPFRPATAGAAGLGTATLGAPIFLSPTRLTTNHATSLAAAAATINGQSPTGLTSITGATGFPATFGAAPQLPGAGAQTDLHQMMASAAGLIYSPLDPSLAAASAFQYQPYQTALTSGLTSPLIAGEYPGLDSQMGAILNQRRILGQAREHPYSRANSQLTPPSQL